MAKKKTTSKPVNNLVIVSDFHCGCRLGLCPPEPIPLDDGGSYTASELQNRVWAWWLEFWNEWVPRAGHNEPFDVVVNGDAVDGVHHNAVTQISNNLVDQATVAERCMEPVVAHKLFRQLYWIRGTEAHVGPSGQEEERLARLVGAIPNELGQYARWELWKRVGGPNGPLCHVLHHIGTTGRAAYESSAPQAELIAEFAEAAQHGDVPPDFVIRSHRHRYIKVDNPTTRGEASAIVTPGWQLRTPFVYKLPGGRISLPQFGGVLIRQGDEEFYSRRWYRKLDRPRVEE